MSESSASGNGKPNHARKPRTRKRRHASQDKDTDDVAAALTELVVWASYPGHDDATTQPPAVDLRRLARLVRLLVTENSRLAARATEYITAGEELVGLRRAGAADAKLIAHLRARLEALSGAPAWDTPSPETPKVAPATVASEPTPVVRGGYVDPQDAHAYRAKRGESVT